MTKQQKNIKIPLDVHEALMNDFHELNEKNESLLKKYTKTHKLICRIQQNSNCFVKDVDESVLNLIETISKYTDITTFKDIIKNWDAGKYCSGYKYEICNTDINKNDTIIDKTGCHNTGIWIMYLINHIYHEGYNIYDVNQDAIDEIMNDIIIETNNPYINASVAEQGYFLNKLINHKSPIVRRAVAKQGYGLHNLINDKDESVRAAVAEQDSGLRVLINDESEIVRAAVAKQAYKLDVLINDPSPYVRAAIVETITNTSPTIHAKVVEQTEHNQYIFEKLINDESPIVRATIAKQTCNIYNHRNYDIPGFEILVTDPSPFVRTVVAEQGKFCEQLIDDESDIVRISAIRNYYRDNWYTNDNIKKLINESSPDIRTCIAIGTKDENILMKLANDESPLVCTAVAIALRLNSENISKHMFDKIYNTLSDNKSDIVKSIIHLKDKRNIGIDTSTWPHPLTCECAEYNYIDFLNTLIKYINNTYNSESGYEFIKKNSPYYTEYKNMKNQYRQTDDDEYYKINKIDETNKTDNNTPNKKPKKYIFTHKQG